MENQDFIPVLLGSDINVYGMARSFHEAYGYRSVAVGKGVLGVCQNSKILEVRVTEPRLEEDAVFVRTLLDFAEGFSRPLLLVPCGDNYIKLLVRNQDALRGRYVFSCIDEALLMRLSIKEHFYEVCQEHGFAFPKTDVCTADNYREKTLPFDFPVIIKPSNSVAYWNCDFPHKKKVFLAQSQTEFTQILQAIYGSSYHDPLILQEYIPGDDSQMRVLNCFSGTDGKVKLIALGNALLEEHSPQGIGSYAAILNSNDPELSRQIQSFLESLHYIGFANFDMKLDPRDHSYKLFEMNLRPGRSSYFVTAGGYNIAQWLAEDVFYQKALGLTVATNQALWTLIPKRIIFQYVKDPALLAQTKKLIRAGKIAHSYWYRKDRSFRRWIAYLRNQLNYFHKYRKYFGHKGLQD